MPRKTIGRFTGDSKSSPALGGMRDFVTPEYSDTNAGSAFNFFTGEIANSEVVTPEQVQRIKQEAKAGDIHRLYDLYERMEVTDTRYGGMIESYFNAVTRNPIKVEPADTRGGRDEKLAQDYADMVEDNLNHLNESNLLRQFLKTAIYGARVFGVKYRVEGSAYNKKFAYIDDVQAVPHEVLRMDKKPESNKRGEMAIQMNEEDEFPTPVSDLDSRMVFTLHDGEGRGKYHLMGKARKCLTWWLLRRYAQIWWSEYVEVYGQPLRVGYYPQGSKDELIRRMQGFMETLGKDHYGLFPQGSDIKMEESKNSGSNTIFSDLMSMGADEMAIALFGQVETMGDRRYGSRAKAQELAKIRFEELEHAARVGSRGFTELAHRIVGANYGWDYDRSLLPTAKPVIVDPAAANEKMKRFDLMAKAGVPVPLDHIYEQGATPKPKDGQQVLVPSGTTTFTPETDYDRQSGNRDSEGSGGSEQSAPSGEGNRS